MPRPGELLWDVGAGAGSIGIEWMRAHPSCRAIAVEQVPERAERIAGNARSLGVPGLVVVVGEAPDALAELPAPAAVFIGGGASRAVIERCWAALPAGGRLVVHAVTHETEMVMALARSDHGGELTRIAIEHLEPDRPFHRLEAGPPGRPVECGQGVRVTIHFIGAGPGAADLLTVRATRMIAVAPVCVYAGTYVDSEVLALCPEGAELIDSQHLDLDAITDRLVSAHAAGRDVARLCSGDPSIYSALAEQTRRLDRAGVPWDVTPGVPAYAAAAALLGARADRPRAGPDRDPDPGVRRVDGHARK